jgi:arylsulfatase A-like enzyme
MNKSIYLLGIPLLGSMGITAKEAVKPQHPNVMIIFPDQLRRYSAGFWQKAPYKKHVIGKSDPVVTPTIDRLAKNGVVFTNALSNYPLSSPYRGMLLTGKYPQKNGIWGNCRKGRAHKLRDDVETLTDVYHKAGYHISYFGKCHWEKTEPLFDKNGNYVGTTQKPGGKYINAYDTYVPPGPTRHNIEYFYQGLVDSHFNTKVFSSDPNLVGGKKDGDMHRPHTFSAKDEAQAIIQYLKNERNQRDPNKPFFTMWALNPPHAPWNDANTEMEVLKENYGKDKFSKNKDLLVRDNVTAKKAKYVRNYFSNVTSVDKYIGWVVDELEKQGVLDNTIIIFSSDHGEMLGSHNKSGKNVMEQEAVAIPFIVHYPKKVKKGLTDILLGVTDVMPALMSLSGIRNLIPEDVQGEDYSEFILNPETTKLQKPESVLLLLGNARGIQSNEYTLCVKENKKGKIQELYLYDNINDPYQKQKLSQKDRPKVYKELLRDLGEKLKKFQDPWFLAKKHNDLIEY